MSKPKVLLLGTIDLSFSRAKQAWEEFSKSEAEIVTPQSTKREDFIKECQDGKLDGVVACYRTFASVSITGPWDDELTSALPKSLRFVSHNGAGYDQLTISALSDHNIIATHVPTAVDNATADTGIYLMLGALRNFNTSVFALRNHKWRGQPAPAYGHDPQGKLLGILGMGGIGKNFARKAKAFGMTIQYHNRNPVQDAEVTKELQAKYVSFDELMETSDVISVNVPLNKNTRHLVDAKALAKCKKGVCIVNTARGAVIDEAALVEALDSGQVGSVGLDVFEEEPKIHEGLLKNDRAMLLPHMGTWTVETQTKMEEWNMGNIKCALHWMNSSDKSMASKMSVVPEQRGMWSEMVDGKK